MKPPRQPDVALRTRIFLLGLPKAIPAPFQPLLMATASSPPQYLPVGHVVSNSGSGLSPEILDSPSTGTITVNKIRCELQWE